MKPLLRLIEAGESEVLDFKKEITSAYKIGSNGQKSWYFRDHMFKWTF
jgi:hypothetical protein